VSDSGTTLAFSPVCMDMRTYFRASFLETLSELESYGHVADFFWGAQTLKCQDLDAMRLI